jgi:predicted GTPase
MRDELEDRRGALIECIDELSDEARHCLMDHGSDVIPSPPPRTTRSRSRKRATQNAPPRNVGLSRHIDAIVASIGDGVEAWKETIQRDLEATQFTTLFDESLIVMVYGLVNSGKSTLGNTVAGLPFRGHDDDPYAGEPLVFRKHADASDGELRTTPFEQDGFPTDGVECTREIQEFTFGGLSWVDTPGLLSITGENHALARRYIDHAELVVYVTSSSSPMRASEAQVLRELVSAGKKAVVVVTKFDIQEEDYDEDLEDFVSRIKLKPDKNRVEQREWLEQQITDNDLDTLLLERTYCFVSCHAAQSRLGEGEGVEAAVGQAGFDVFYEQLGSILTERATELKAREPRRRFDALVTRVNGTRADAQEMTVTGLIGQIDQQLSQLQHTRQELMGLGPMISNRTEVAAQPHIIKVILEAQDRLEADAPIGDMDAAVRAIISRELGREMQRAIAQSLHDLMSEIGSLSLLEGSWEVPPLEQLYEDIDVSATARNGAIGGALGGLGAFAVTLALGANPVTLPVVLGSFAASVVGREAGKALTTKETKRILKGTNAQEVTQKFLEDVTRKLRPYVDANLGQLANDHLDPLTGKLKRCRALLRKHQTKIDGLRFDVSSGRTWSDKHTNTTRGVGRQGTTT